MTRFSKLALTGHLSAALFILASLAMPTLVMAAANDRYRIELIVFRNLDVLAEPDQVQQIRSFFDTFDLQVGAAPPAPVMLEKSDGSFTNIWTRLDRLAAYQPLLRLTFEQTMFDYHPPVRIHNQVVMGQQMYFPADIIYLDLANYEHAAPADQGVDLFADYMQALYQLDGTLRLRRSRFLHLDLDLEFRLPGPAWAREFPTQPDDLLEPGFEWLGTAPEPVQAPQPLRFGEEPLGVDPAMSTPVSEPFELHRLQQSRQIRSNTLQYFDSAYLGAIVRVTPIAAEAP